MSREDQEDGERKVHEEPIRVKGKNGKDQLNVPMIKSVLISTRCSSQIVGIVRSYWLAGY